MALPARRTRALGPQFEHWQGPVLPPRRPTRQHTELYKEIGRDYSDPAEYRRSFGYNLNLPIPDDDHADIYLKRGYLVYESEVGRRLTWDWVTYLGKEVLKDYSYFYIISSDAKDIDDVDHEGRTKLGYSAAKSSKAGCHASQSLSTVAGAVSLAAHARCVQQRPESGTSVRDSSQKEGEAAPGAWTQRAFSRNTAVQPAA